MTGMFWSALNILIHALGCLLFLVCTAFAFDAITSFNDNSSSQKPHFLIRLTRYIFKVAASVAAAILCVTTIFHFMNNPLFPDAKERKRLVSEMKSINEELSTNDQISEELYNRMIAFNRDNEAYDAKHKGCGVDNEFHLYIFDVDSFKVKARMDGAYNGYKVYVNGIEVPMDKIMLDKFADKFVTVNDEDKEIYITR